jgi:hypothetical protein
LPGEEGKVLKYGIIWQDQGQEPVMVCKRNVKKEV